MPGQEERQTTALNCPRVTVSGAGPSLKEERRFNYGDWALVTMELNPQLHLEATRGLLPEGCQ